MFCWDSNSDQSSCYLSWLAFACAGALDGALRNEKSTANLIQHGALGKIDVPVLSCGLLRSKYSEVE